MSRLRLGHGVVTDEKAPHLVMSYHAPDGGSERGPGQVPRGAPGKLRQKAAGLPHQPDERPRYG
eukprot:5415285-Heterocapsa_arctica.AAC.1